jgi:CubicO group peptidase (beta-lactamase class C family)
MDSSAIDPERTVGYYLAGAGLGRTLASETARLPLGSLLNHTSGLPPIPALQAFFPDPARIDRDEAIARLLAIRPEAEVGARVAYSCTGYMILGVVLESVSGVSLGELFRREMAEPLRLPRAKFGRAEPGRTSEPAPLSGAAATELCAWRGRRVRGQVHDESAFCLGGQAGNAGLFVSLDDVERLAGLMADGGRLDGRRILSERSVARMTTDSTPGLEERRGYGYRLHDEATVDGPAWPRPTFGHTGFTGGSLFIEPGRRLVSIALTNRVYFGRDETAPRIAEFRRAFNALAWRAAGPFGAVDADIEYSTAY